MDTVIVGAVRARGPQSAMVLILAALLAAAAAAAPWYGLAVASRVATADVAAASAAQRVVSVRRPVPATGDPHGVLGAFAREVPGLLPVTGARPVLGVAQEMYYKPPASGAATARISLAYRDDFCAHVRLAGRCPAGPGEAAISRDSAQRLKLREGATIGVRATASGDPARLRITGIYELTDASGAYWTSAPFRASGGLDPAFTPLATFRAPQTDRPVLVYDLEVPEPLLRGDNGYDLAAELAAARTRMKATRTDLVDDTARLLDRVRDDRLEVLREVLLATGVLLMLGWFAIGLAGQAGLRDRRGDAGLLKLRGSSRSSMLRMTAGQHLLPLLGGALAGLPLGFAAGRVLAGELPVPAEIPVAVLASAGAALVVLLGGLLVLAVVDGAMLRLPVPALLRRAATRRRGWAGDVGDLAVVAVAAAAVYQGRTGGPASGLGRVAPILTALALALLFARLLRAATDRAGGAAVRQGRLRAGLAAVQMSRQSGTDRVFALVATSVALLALAGGSLVAGRADRAARAEVELGADRVLSVRAPTRTALLSAVRRADPGGRAAMAAVVELDSIPPVLTVDSDRLAAVARWRPEYGRVTALAEAMRAARVPAPLPVTGARLELRVRNGRAVPAQITAVLQHEGTGAVVEAVFHDVRPGESAATATARGCTVAPGCRLVRWQVSVPVIRDGRPITLLGLRQRGPDAEIAGPAALGDVTRWYPDVGGVALQLVAGRNGLTMTAPDPGEAVAGDKVYAADAPRPLPVVLAGRAPAEWRFADAASSRFGVQPVPVTVAGAATMLPVVGRQGVMADLDAVRRNAADAEPGGDFQVWLAAGAPPSIVDDLHAAGLTVNADRSAAGREAQLAERGEVVGARFGLLTAIAALLIAAAAIAVSAAADRDPVAEQFRALRVQGLTERTAVAAGYAGTVVPVAAALAAGVMAAVLAVPITGLAAPPFGDGWRLVAAPAALGAAPLTVAALAAAVVLALTTWAAARPLAHRLRDGHR